MTKPFLVAEARGPDSDFGRHWLSNLAASGRLNKALAGKISPKSGALAPSDALRQISHTVQNLLKAQSMRCIDGLIGEFDKTIPKGVKVIRIARIRSFVLPA
jgi:hypothetical protein